MLNIQNLQEGRTAAVSGTRDWSRVSTVFQSDAATELEINCLFAGWGTASGQAWYDDLALEQVADPPSDTQASVNREWTLPLLKAAGPYLDYISIHNYWLPLWQTNDMPDYLTCIIHSESPEQLIANYVGVLEDSGYRGRIKIAFDEWHLRSWHHPGFPRKSTATPRKNWPAPSG